MEKKDASYFLKLSGVILAIILGLWFIQSLLFGQGFGIGLGMRGNFGGEHMGMGAGAGLGTGFTISTVLLFLIKVLFILFIVGLVIGVAIAVKKLVFTQEDIQRIKSTFTVKTNTAPKTKCTICGKELENEWKACPFCGVEKAIENI